ncbi:MAG TPA: hypothetical protein VK470_03975, partial [Bacteroidota bacterium]|nr:hypothetical protein [Bacteroidota bacterium]
MKRVAATCLMAGGVMELLLALLHFTWPFQLLTNEEFSRLSAASHDVVLLCVLAVGLLLFVFGGLSIYFSTRIEVAAAPAVIFGYSQGLLWLGRTILEIVLPVRVPLFMIANPSTYILAGAILLTLIYSIPMFLLGKAKK